MSDKSYLRTVFPICITLDKSIYTINQEEFLLKVTCFDNNELIYDLLSPYVGIIDAEKVIDLLQEGKIVNEPYIKKWSQEFPGKDFRALICSHPSQSLIPPDFFASLPTWTIDDLVKPIPFQCVRPGYILVGEGKKRLYTTPIKKIFCYGRWYQ